MIKYALLLCCIFLAACNGTDQKQIRGKDASGIVIVQQDDVEMQSAIGKAQASLSTFDAALKERNERYNSFSLKVRYPYGEGNGEHIWLKDITNINGQYKGIINNEPEYVANLQFGDTVTINRQHISDWMYFDNDSLVGGYTLRLLRGRMTPQERAALDSSGY